jgi:threonine synthase
VGVLIGMWKAFEEMEALGWVKGKRPRMYALQASGCAPVTKAFDEGKDVSEFYKDAATFAAGLRVPKAYGDWIILEIVRASGGSAVSSDDAEILASILDWAKHEGIFLSPEGAAATAAYDKLLASGEIKPGERVVLFNTGAGLKYTDMTAEAMGLKRA